MQNPMIFIEGKAVLVSHIVYIDFSLATALHEKPRLKMHLSNGTDLIITDQKAIDFLIQGFVPESLRGNYKKVIEIVRGVS